MSEPTSESSKAALREFIDAEIAVTGLDSPADEKKLRDTVETREGVQSVNFLRGKLSVTYDPVRVSKAELLDAIRGAGFTVEEIESASASPLTDALKSTDADSR